jgi:hypothetical protein
VQVVEGEQSALPELILMYRKIDFILGPPLEQPQLVIDLSNAIRGIESANIVRS